MQASRCGGHPLRCSDRALRIAEPVNLDRGGTRVFGYRLMRWPSIGVASTLLFAAALWHFLPRASETEGRAVAATMRVAPMQIGVNLPSLDAFSGQRVFANLATVSRWRSAGNRPWTIMPPEQLDKDGAVKFGSGAMPLSG
jgi:hypothetical protein